MNIFERLTGTNYPKESGIENDFERVPDEVLYKNADSVMKSNDIIKKGFGGRDKAMNEPMVYNYDIAGINPFFREKPGVSGAGTINNVLKQYSTAPLFQAILSTRSGQVSRYTQPVSQSNDGLGYRVTLTDSKITPTASQLRTIREAEHFIQYMGVDDPSMSGYKKRDDFDDFCTKLIRDTYTFDQVNAEKTFNNKGKLHHIKAIDPTTIYRAVNRDSGKIIPDKYVQVFDDRIVNKFSDEDLIMAIRRPRTDIYSSGYGQSELEIALQQFLAMNNTMMFNDRFFSHGGSVQGIINIKPTADTSGIGKSRRQLADFRRNFESRVTGVASSWQYPVTTADDVKYVNLTPNARDMEFEKWINFLINICSSVFNIDPAEVGFPNKGGATGSKSNSLNEGNSKQKLQASMNKGLASLLRFIEKVINNEIIKPYFGNNYLFQFVGEDISGETERVQLLAEEVKTYRTVNEIRVEKNLDPIKGGDVILNQFAIQRLGQLQQEKQIEHQWQQEKLSMLSSGPQPDSGSGISFQDVQSGLDGSSDKVNGKDTFNGVKNGQVADSTRTDKINYGGKPDE